ncbi:glycosyltransferase [Sulfurospirillum oryzae]|uniref:glycosyltransferase n=1 Tax=Sulfurospirillum oryzae TaxID=2976535 RepID=UPI0021E87F5E|nr:glycosyltransferase [Sulfurospirillum oryzae]
MKQVCMITHDAPHIDRRILLQAKTLIKNGYDVSIIYPFGDANSDFANVGIKYIPIMQQLSVKNGLSFFKKTLRILLPQKMYVKIKELYFKVAKNDFIDYEEELKVKSLEKKYDIYVAHDLPALLIAHYAAKQNGSKLVYDSHEFFTGQIALQGNRKQFFQNLEKKLIYDVDLFFTVNEDIANLFVNEYGIAPPQVLLNSIEENEQISSVNLYKKLGIHESKNIILYQGGFLEDRNLEILVQSAQYLEENNILVMLGYSFLEDKLKKIAKKLNIIHKKVYFMDRVTQKELLNYTAGATIGVIPYPDIDLNTKYCTPNKMFEFITAEVPIVANEKLVTASKILKKLNIGYFISFESPKSIADGLNQSLLEIKNVSFLENIKKAKQKLSWGNQENILIDSYQKL